jgi:hypothetical protein
LPAANVLQLVDEPRGDSIFNVNLASSVVELLFMPSVYAPCPTCHGTRYNEKTLAI